MVFLVVVVRGAEVGVPNSVPEAGTPEEGPTSRSDDANVS